MPDAIPRIIITAGEPAGIGPDIVLCAALEKIPARIAALADPVELRKRAKVLNLAVEIKELQQNQIPPPHQAGVLWVVSINCPEPVVAQELNSDNSYQVIQTIETATAMCIDQIYHAMVTAPVHKAVINQAGIKFSGHTEWIAAQCNSESPVMMLADRQLKVCLATTHLPLSAVPAAITAELLQRVLKIMDRDIGSFYALENPRIGVCGLNPHAGEGGYLGREEIETISPTIKQLNAQGYNLTGPLPADTAFTQEQLKNFDAVLAMYHDQGLPVIKHQGFGEVVNVTLGLPIIRTSVDHGTALDLAGTGKANATSLISAVELAMEFAANKFNLPSNNNR